MAPKMGFVAISDRTGLNRHLAINLRNKYLLDTFIETGTYRGETCSWAATAFMAVVSIESDPKRYEKVKSQFSGLRNLTLICGDSRTELREVLNYRMHPALIWLDAHLRSYTKHGWLKENDQCPLREELEAIRDSRTGHIVMIDDATFFLDRPPFDHQPEQWPTRKEIEELLPNHTVKKLKGWNTLLAEPKE